jgi:hypothetical protein
MLHFFQSFIAKMHESFRRIAKATKHEITVDDLHNDSWVIALELGDRRGRPIDFSDPADQDLVIRAVNHRNVRRGDWKMRRSVRIDQEPESEEAVKWVERLPARASSDPLVYLLARESALDTDAILAASYSQATAYAITFSNFKNDRHKICSYLVVSERALGRRATVAAYSMRMQPSMFDRIERIPADFMPLRGKQYTAIIGNTRESEQAGWAF